MRSFAPVMALGVIALQLCGCNQSLPEPSVLLPKPAPAEPGPAQGRDPDTSVPPAATVFAPATETKTDMAAGRSNRAMSRAQESTAMPMPGQNNDHSAPLTPAKRASGR